MIITENGLILIQSIKNLFLNSTSVVFKGIHWAQSLDWNLIMSLEPRFKPKIVWIDIDILFECKVHKILT